MELVAFSCPCCGARLRVDAQCAHLRCEYCESIISRERQNIDLPEKQPVQVALSIDELLDRAYSFIEAGDFIRVYEDIKTVLELEPDCARAVMGKLLCVMKLTDLEKLVIAPMHPAAFQLYTKALQLAAGNTAKLYRQINERRRERIEEQRRKMEADIAAIQEHLMPRRIRLHELSGGYHKGMTKLIIWLMLFLVVPSITGTVFIMVWSYYNLLLIWLVIATALFAILAVIMMCLANKPINAYNKEKRAAAPLEAELKRLQSNLSAWLACNQYVQ